MTRTSRPILIILLVLSVPGPAQAQTTWHVDDDCAPPGVGTEIDPFCTIQDGVDAASDGDTVLVAPGVFAGGGNRDISLFGKTIALQSTDGPDSTTMDLEGNPQSIHRGFFLIHGETADTIIEGFTIMNGYLIGDTGGSGAAGGGGGAGIYIRDSSPTIRNCIVRDNFSATLGVPLLVDGRAGGVYIDGNSDAIIETCFITENTGEKRGGGMYVGYATSEVIIRDCLIAHNTGGGGGGIYNTFGNTLITNTTIANNWAGTGGGGGLVSENSDAFLSNCILWGNRAREGSEISFSCGLVPTIEYGHVQGVPDSIKSFCDSRINWGPGNIDGDPMFFDPENSDYHFLHGSPCVDAGNNLAVPEDVTTDLDGDARFLDDPDTPDTGNPDPDAPDLPIVDMGPYEFDHQDCNNNDVPDEEDLENETSIDINDDGLPDECQLDCNDNGIPDVTDIADGSSTDCDGDGWPDECQIEIGSPVPGGPFYCDPLVQSCDLDCNANGQPDACDISSGADQDCGGEGIPDDCSENPGPVITAQPVSQDVGPGDLVFFSVQADGVLPEYQWRKDGVDLQDDARIIGSGSSLLVILDVIPDDAGAYDCEVTDFADDCARSNPATLTVTDPCPADFDDDGSVGASDLAFLLGSWGPNPNHPADLNNDGAVGAFDLAQLLGSWGPCP